MKKAATIVAITSIVTATIAAAFSVKCSFCNGT
jgi:hypothetical protein